MNTVLIGMSVVGVLGAIAASFFMWRWASRVWPLPCPATFAWLLGTDLYARFTGTDLTLRRMRLAPGQRVLEIGPGPGRLLIPAARLVLPDGEVVGIDIQAGMVERLKSRAHAAGLTNLKALVGDATKPMVRPDSCDVVFLATTLGEIPDRAAVLRQCFLALKPGGTLSITEMLPDPHYQSRATVIRLAEAAGFKLSLIEGNAWLFTVNLVKPRLRGTAKPF